MNDLGEYLKKEREKKGITLEEASKITRIRKAYLQALEDSDIGMQSPVFIKGFLKSYAEFLGLDSTEIIEKYNDILNDKKGHAEGENGFELEPVSTRSRHLIPGVLVLALVTAIFLLTTFNTKPDTTPEQAQKSSKVDLPEQKPVLSNTTPATPATPKPAVQTVKTPEKPEKQHSLIATAREVTWLQVTVDNNDPAEVLLREGESTRWLADTKITVVVGNAGGVNLTYNGKLLESLGPSGKVVTKMFPE